VQFVSVVLFWFKMTANLSYAEHVVCVVDSKNFSSLPTALLCRHISPSLTLQTLLVH